MITLLSVRLHNFRAVQDATFSPLTQGITGLSGPNGVGKSAFLEGTLWALYGVVPKDVPQASLRRQGAPTSAECYVQVEFEHQGQKIVVTRSLRGKQGTAVLDIWLDGKEATVRSVKVGEKWIRDRFKLDASGFTTAVLVRQKELDALVEATPAERRVLIERLSGIDRMSSALKRAREELSDARKFVDSTRGSKEEVDEAAALLAEFESNLDDSRDALALADERASMANDHVTAAQKSWDELQAAGAVAQQALTSVASAESRLARAHDALKEARERLNRAQSAMPEGGWDERAMAKAQQEYQQARSALDRLQAQEHSSSEKAEQQNRYRQAALESELNQVETKIADLGAKIAEKSAALEEVSPEEIDTAQEALDAATTTRRADEQALANKDAEVRALEESLANLHGKNECPTCHSSIDDPDKVLGPLHALLARLQDEAQELRLALEASTEDLAAANEVLSDLQRKASETRAEKERIEAARNTVDHYQANAQRIKNELDGLRDDLQQILDLRRSVAEQKPALVEAVERTNEELRKAMTGRQAWQEFQEATAQVSQAESAVSEAQEALDIALAFADEHPEPESAVIEIARRSLAETNAAFVAARETLRATEGEVRLLEERVRNARADLDRAEKDYEMRRSVLERVEHTSAVANVLDEFRREQIARIAPELSETATSLISQMTNGRFIEVELDENFTPTIITNDGTRLPSSWLSGGELSVVALALRIAIANLLTGGTGGLLWLDEVLTAQDADRRAALIETLRSLPGHQIVMINHTQGADDIVDKTVRLMRTDDGGTIVDES